MSFLTERALVRCAAIAAKPRFAAAAAPRTFTTTIAARKGPVEATKDGVKTVDRAVSDQLVKGLDGAETVSSKVKETADKVAGKTSGKASELKGEAKGAAAEAKGKAKGAAEEVKSKI